MARKTPATFTIRIGGEGVAPESIPVRTLSDAASAVLRLAMGSGEDSGRVRVLDVKRGSAVYPCLIDDGPNVSRNLVAAGEVARNPRSEKLAVEMLNPIKEISAIAGKFDAGKVEVYLGDVATKDLRTATPVISFLPTTYSAIEETALIRDSASVYGYLVGVGGAEARKCRIRVAGRHKLLYCSVADSETSRRLGENLYTYVTLDGIGTYFQRTDTLLDFQVLQMHPTFEDSTESILRELRTVCGDGWSNVENIDAELRSLR